MDVVQAPAGFCESCGLPVPVHRICVISACWAGQSFRKLIKCSVCLQEYGWANVIAKWNLTSAGSVLTFNGCMGTLIFYTLLYFKVSALS